MFELKFLLLLGIVLLTLEYGRAVIDESYCGPKIRYAPDDQNCTVFYDCYRKQKLVCPSGLVFDPAKQSCEYAWNASRCETYVAEPLPPGEWTKITIL